MEQEVLDALEVQKALGEAGGTVWGKIYGHKLVDGQTYTIEINITSRELNAELALESYIRTVKIAGEKYNMFPYNLAVRTVEAPKTAPVPAPVKEEDPFKDPVYESVDGVQYLNVIKLKILPGTDGNTLVEMYCAGREYADLKVKMTPEKLVGMFKNTGKWTSAHFERPSEMVVNYSVGWKNSTNLNKNGKPYKNVTTIELA
jgi:hypothetical protein